MNDWQPIETAPRDGTPVLACVAGADFWPDKVQWDATHSVWVYPCRCHGPALAVTHWLPLPLGPHGEAP